MQMSESLILKKAKQKSNILIFSVGVSVDTSSKESEQNLVVK